MSVSACCLCRLFWHAIISLWTHSAKHAGAAIVKCAAWRVQCECEAIVQCECAVIVKCATCGEWSVQHVESEVWSVKCAAWRVQCECECGAWGTHFEITEFTVSVSVAHEARTLRLQSLQWVWVWRMRHALQWVWVWRMRHALTVSVSVAHEARTLRLQSLQWVWVWSMRHALQWVWVWRMRHALTVSVSVAHEARTLRLQSWQIKPSVKTCDC